MINSDWVISPPQPNIMKFIKLIKFITNFVNKDIESCSSIVDLKYLDSQQLINLSKYSFTNVEKHVLKLGLAFNQAKSTTKFVKHKTDYHDKLELDIKNTVNSLKRKFQNDDLNIFNNVNRRFTNSLNVDFSKFKLKNNNLNLVIYNEQLNNGLEYLKEQVLSAPYRLFKPNLNKQECLAMKNLKNLRNIQNLKFLKADKLSQMVVLNQADYIKSCNKLLLDENNYRKIDFNLNNLAIGRIKKLSLEALRNHTISKSLFDFIIDNFKNVKNRNFYCLPKTHKEKEKWIDEIPPFRPIVSENGSETQNSGQILAAFLKPIFENLESYLKNSFDMIEKLNKIVFESKYLLIVADVDALYPNIPIQTGLDRVKKRLDLHNQMDLFLFELLKIQCETNYFTFNDQFYHQIRGIPMGKSWAPAFASIYMDDFDQILIKKLHNRPILYCRYIDDIFIIVDNEQDIIDFESLANNIDPNIHLSGIQTGKIATFLDLNIHITSTSFEYSTHLKLDIGNLMMDRFSDHPEYIKIGLINSQLIRFFNQNSNFENLFLEIKKFLVKLFFLRHYDKQILLKGTLSFLKWFCKKNYCFKFGNDYEKEKNLENTKNVYFITEYFNDAPDFHHILNDYLASLDKKFRGKVNKIIHGFRMQKNLYRELFRY